MGGNKLGKNSKTVLVLLKKYRTQDTRIGHIYLCAVSSQHVSQAYSCCCCVPISAGTHLGPHHMPMGSDSDGHDYESLATLDAVAIAPFAKHY